MLLLACNLSAGRRIRIKLICRESRQDGATLSSSLGAGDEAARSDFAGDGETTWWQAAKIFGLSREMMDTLKDRPTG